MEPKLHSKCATDNLRLDRLWRVYSIKPTGSFGYEPMCLNPNLLSETKERKLQMVQKKVQ